jgi:hypothetical protein
MQNVLGTYYACFFPESGKCIQARLEELNDYKVIDAKHENHVLVVITSNLKTKKYDRLVFRFSDNYQEHDVRIIEDIDTLEINFTVADHGIAVLIAEDGELEAFSNKRGSSVKVMKDNVIDTEMKLFHRGTQILFHQGKKVYKLSMK